MARRIDRMATIEQRYYPDDPPPGDEHKQILLVRGDRGQVLVSLTRTRGRGASTRSGAGPNWGYEWSFWALRGAGSAMQQAKDMSTAFDLVAGASDCKAEVASIVAALSDAWDEQLTKTTV